MIGEESLADLSPGGRQLLRMAHRNDRFGILTRNACLHATLEAAWKIAGDAAASLSERWMFERAPSNFLALVVNLLQSIRDDLDRRSDFDVTFRREYDRHVLQAFALALADVVWTARGGNDFHGPSIEVCWERLAKTRPPTLALRTIHHYVGNILQHFFDAARIREQVRELPEDTEVDLRREDARLIAAEVAQRAGEIERSSDIDRFLDALDVVLDEARR